AQQRAEVAEQRAREAEAAVITAQQRAEVAEKRAETAEAKVARMTQALAM
ncbi:Uma2 family endonuclease, partial [bacterium]|nr:Uma2 family endonuclease [bacterium]